MTAPFDKDALEKSEDRYRSLFESSLDGIVFTDMTGYILAANRAYLDMLGYTLDEVTRLTYQELTPEKWHEMEAGLVESQITVRGYSDLYRKEYIRKDGSVFPINIRTWLFHDELGVPVGMWAIVRDITERKEMEQALEAEKAFTEIVFNSLTDVFYVLSIEQGGRMVRWNQSLRDVSGYNDEELAGMTVYDFYDAPGQAEQDRFLQTLMSEGAATIESEVVTKTGRRIPYHFSSALIRDAEGTPTFVCGVGRDITERKRAEEELQRVNTELEGFAHTVSHDLKSPLTAIGLASETLELLLEKGNPVESIGQIKEITKILNDNISKSKALIEDILTLAEAAHVVPEREEVSVDEVVRRVLDEKAAEISRRGVRVLVGEDLGRVHANPTHVYQVVANLLGNSIRHSDSPDPEVEVSRLGECGEGCGRYLVRDNGSGISPEDLGNIFIPFFKGHDTGETGVGLSIVEKIVGAYGGSISAYNDGGACFEFTLGGQPDQDTGE